METTPYILNEFNPFTLETSVSEIKLFFKENPFTHFHNSLPQNMLIEEIQRYDFGLVPHPPDWHSLNVNFALPNWSLTI